MFSLLYRCLCLYPPLFVHAFLYPPLYCVLASIILVHIPLHHDLFVFQFFNFPFSIFISLLISTQFGAFPKKLRPTRLEMLLPSFMCFQKTSLVFRLQE
ncbi:unnamed protein product [Amoebophrya sp. A25]|nr:unnamed protein product [Amoebophrya sp. A25]|eukprot:GSA25T00010499001.1